MWEPDVCSGEKKNRETHTNPRVMSTENATPLEDVSLGDAIVNTSEANIVDLYVRGELKAFDFFYKLTCGALVGMVSLQANTMVRELTDVIAERLEEFARRKTKVERYVIHLVIEILVIAAVFEASVALLRLAKSTDEEEEEE